VFDVGVFEQVAEESTAENATHHASVLHDRRYGIASRLKNGALV
jgi:hypothetical protein